MRWFSISSVEEVQQALVGVRQHAAEAVLLLARREVGREEEHRQLAALVERVGELAELLAQQVQLVLFAGDLEQRARVYLGELLHQLFGRRGDAAEVQLAQRLLDQPALVGIGERLAGDLLGGQDRQVGDLAADVVAAPARVAASMLRSARLAASSSDLLAAPLGLLLVRLGRLAGALDDLVGLRARLLQPLAVFGQDLVRLLRGSARRCRSSLRSPAGGVRGPR